MDEPKYVLDMGVFLVTAIMSIFAYCWLYICLLIRTPNEVTIEEAWLTIVFFVILVVVAFAADRYNAAMMKKNETEEDAKRIAEENAKKSKKHELRTFAKNFAAYGGDQVMIEIATGMTTPNTQKVSDNEK